jgi:hypothetical protein
MKNQILYCLFFVVALQSCNDKKFLSKEAFREKISKSVDSLVEFSFLDDKTIVQPDTAYNLPSPIYKARVVASTDTLFFYYYPPQDLDTVFKLRWNPETFTINTPVFDCGNVFVDTTSGNFVIYFGNCPSVMERFEEADRRSTLDSSLAANLGYVTRLKLEKIQLEEEEREPPPPPPPPNRKKKKATQ